MTTSRAARIAARTPRHRDRTVDALRAIAIIGVVLGHWLVTAVVSDPYQPASLHLASPLTQAPQLAPVTWFLQTLGPFFFAGGFAAARSVRHRKPLPWLLSRMRRLTRPVLVPAAAWSLALVPLTLIGAPGNTRQLVWTLVSQPGWFLLVYLALTLCTPLLRAVVLRWGLWAALAPVVLVALNDTVRSDSPPGWLELLITPLAWAAPYLLGIALAERRVPRPAGATLAVSGAVLGAVLVLFAGYPANAVGVPGDRWSNLSPPSLFTLALAATQLGVFLLLRPWLARLLRRAAVWAPVAGLNLAAMTIYCWHQTALLLVTFTGLLAGHAPGLLGAPTGDWPLYRLLWLPAFALTLACLTFLLHRFETTRRGDAGGAASRPQ
ncbi:acyltransferase [Amycolatopsis sp. GM8]|uniref:acyltransferase family protein n=1 Tax=Amycolatopsis sp. GM8 TaxID=2896530 RepID=UPI001F491724|nr:acyltransferase [Amycolatopsis sp. GM8]